MNEPIIVLKGIAGSVAHGLATPESDEDIHGVFSFPTSAWWSLDKPTQSIVTNDPDVTLHELEKFLFLASKANPSVLDTLYLPEYIEMEPEWGLNLLAIRNAFLSTKAVSDSYMGYARSQFHELEKRGDSFSSGTRNRTYKHAKHLFRLMEQGHRLLTTGELRVRVDDPTAYQGLAELTFEQLSERYKREYAHMEGAVSVLPDQPDYFTINRFLYYYRAAH